MLYRVVAESALHQDDFLFRAFEGTRCEARKYKVPFLEGPLPYEQAEYHCMKLLAEFCGISHA
jgi:hypothetical protein